MKSKRLLWWLCPPILVLISILLLWPQSPGKTAPAPESEANAKPPSPIERLEQLSRRAPGSKPLRTRGDVAVDEAEAQQLNAIFEAADRAFAALSNTPEDGAKRRAVHLEMTRELEAFLEDKPNSAWAPDLHLRLGLANWLRSSYSLSIAHYLAAWDTAKVAEGQPAWQIAQEALSPLARLLALTGRTEQLDALQAKSKRRAARRRPRRGAGHSSAIGRRLTRPRVTSAGCIA